MANEKEQMAMPLQNEMQLANWISGMFGKTANPNYTGATVAAPQLVNQMSGQDMQNLMTEFMRGQGGFLQNMQQARQSGLYNSNTQRLVANDITAQAALKATQANVPIQQGNASLMNQYYAKQGALQPKYLPGNKNTALGGLAIAGLQKLMQGGGKKGSKDDEDLLGKIGKVFTGSADAGADAGSFMDDAIASQDFSSIVPQTETYGFDSFETPDFGALGNGVSDALSQVDLSGFELPDFDLPDFDLDLSGFELPDFDWGSIFGGE
jgi:hypothetical protein